MRIAIVECKQDRRRFRRCATAQNRGLLSEQVRKERLPVHRYGTLDQLNL